TTATSYLRVPKGFLPEFLQDIIELEEHVLPDVQVLPSILKETGIEIGPIPKGTPVNLLANLNMLPDNAGLIERFMHKRKILSLLIKVKKALKALPKNATDEEARQVFLEKDLVEPLLELNKCPDFVVNRGHYFGTDRFQEEPSLSDQEKRDLIEF